MSFWAYWMIVMGWSFFVVALVKQDYGEKISEAESRIRQDYEENLRETEARLMGAIRETDERRVPYSLDFDPYEESTALHHMSGVLAAPSPSLETRGPLLWKEGQKKGFHEIRKRKEGWLVSSFKILARIILVIIGGGLFINGAEMGMGVWEAEQTVFSDSMAIPVGMIIGGLWLLGKGAEI